MIGLDISPGQTGGRISVAKPLAAFFAPSRGQRVAIAQGPNAGFAIWTEIAPNHAACLRIDNDDPTTRLSWRETLIAELRNVYPVGDWTLTGAWSQLQTSGSGLADSYTGNRAVSTASPSAAARVAVDRTEPYDVWVHFTGRTSGGYVKVEVDDAQALVNEIDDPAGLGFKAFPSYSATDLKRRQSIKVASGLTGAHTVRLTSGGAAVPGGTAILLEAISITATLTDPRILPPIWQSGMTYVMGDEVSFGGLYYAARANGVSGTAGPSHASGIASDGALDWRADNRPTYPAFVAMDYSSEREYAARFDVAGQITEVGGQTHGNEALSSRTIKLDGADWVPEAADATLHVGSQITVAEDTVWQTQAGAAVANCRLARTISPGSIWHDVHITGTGPQADVEWLYSGMVPMVRWDGESQTTVVDTVSVPSGAAMTLAGYAGTNPGNIDFPDTREFGLSAVVNGAPFVYGHMAGATAVAGNIVDQFDGFLRPNLDARTASGTTDWSAKAYVTAGTDGGLVFKDGDILGFFSSHVLAMV